MSETMEVAGVVSEADADRLAGLTRERLVGPMTVYYAGVSSPIIVAGMGLVMRAALEIAGLSAYWVALLSSAVAASAGIAWYLIFMRWAARQPKARPFGGEAETRLSVDPDGLTVRRGHVTTRIAWPAVRAVRRGKRGLVMLVNGAEPIAAPRAWFEERRDARRFEALVRTYSGREEE